MTDHTSRLPLAPAVPVEHIEWRVDGKPNTSRTPPTARYVPYIGAATVAGLLDEWVGPDGWSDTYEVGTIGGREAMWCHLSIRGADGSWVTKTDVGTVPTFEPQKGAVSDAFKRAACLRWGAARNVYHLPTLWAPCKVTKNKKTGEDVAWPNEQTVPNLLAELKRLGYGDVQVTRLQPVEERAVDEETGEVVSLAFPNPVSEERARAKARAAGLTDDEIAEMVDRATEGRTDDLAEVHKDEVGALREALAHIVQRKQPAEPAGDDPGRPFEEATGA